MFESCLDLDFYSDSLVNGFVSWGLEDEVSFIVWCVRSW